MNLLQQTHDPDVKYINTQVQTAVKSKDIKALKACIFMAKQVGHFDLNGEDEDGITGLTQACIEGNTEMVQVLLTWISQYPIERCHRMWACTSHTSITRSRCRSKCIIRW